MMEYHGDPRVQSDGGNHDDGRGVQQRETRPRSDHNGRTATTFARRPEIPVLSASRAEIIECNRLVYQGAHRRNVDLESLGGGESSIDSGVPPWFSRSRSARKRLRQVARQRRCDTPEGCGFCQPDRVLGSRPRKRTKLLGAQGPPTKRTTSKGLWPTVPSLRTLAMRSVLVHCRRPSQFETRLPLALANEVWRHLPLRFLSEQRVARFFATGCGCTTEAWLHGGRVVRHIITWCATCLGLETETKKLHQNRIPPCSYCAGPFARCGCPHMPYARVYMFYNEVGHMIQIKLALNRADWGLMGLSHLIGEGYLHGQVAWKRPYTVMGASPRPPTLYFHCGIRLIGAYDHLVLGSPFTARSLLGAGDIKDVPPVTKVASGVERIPEDMFFFRDDSDDYYEDRRTWDPASRSLLFVVERPLEKLPIEAVRRQVGSVLASRLHRHAGRSRTVAVYREVAKIYMEQLLRERRCLGSRDNPGLTPPEFGGCYRLNLGNNIPTDCAPKT